MVIVKNPQSFHRLRLRILLLYSFWNGLVWLLFRLFFYANFTPIAMKIRGFIWRYILYKITEIVRKPRNMQLYSTISNLHSQVSRCRFPYRIWKQPNTRFSLRIKRLATFTLVMFNHIGISHMIKMMLFRQRLFCLILIFRKKPTKTKKSKMFPF